MDSSRDASPSGSTIRQPHTLIFTFELSGTELRVHANSDRRAAEARALLDVQ